MQDNSDWDSSDSENESDRSDKESLPELIIRDDSDLDESDSESEDGDSYDTLPEDIYRKMGLDSNNESYLDSESDDEESLPELSKRYELDTESDSENEEAYLLRKETAGRTAKKKV